MYSDSPSSTRGPDRTGLSSKLTPYIISAPWKRQTYDVYRDAIRKNGHDASMEKSRDAVAEFGSSMRAPNEEMIPILKQICQHPKSSIPIEVRDVMIMMLHGRKSDIPASLEKDPEQATAVETVINATMRHLNADTSRPSQALLTGSKIQVGAEAAISAADRYMARFKERQEQARAHTDAGGSELKASSDRTVKWCQTLAGFTGREIGSSKANAIALVEKCLGDTGIIYPAAKKTDALNVVRQASDYLTSGMLRNILGTSNGVEAAAKKYNEQSKQQPVSQPKFNRQ